MLLNTALTAPADTPECERHAGRLLSICDLGVWTGLKLTPAQSALRRPEQSLVIPSVLLPVEPPGWVRYSEGPLFQRSGIAIKTIGVRL